MLAAIVRISSPWLRAWGVVLACLCLVACDDVAPGDPVLDGGEDAGSDATAFDGLTFDILPLDRPRADAAEVGTTGPCTLDRDCPRGNRCLQSRCVVDACLLDELVCGSDRCNMRCVPTRDLCDGVRCAAEQTCFGGRCIAGCFPSPCAGIRCAAGEFCDDATGRCARITPCASQCDDGFACHLGCVPRSPCDGVTCPDGSLCVNGTCQRNPCAGVTCAAGSLCIDGTCTTTCGCNPACNRSPRDRCVVGRCVCNSLCTSTTPCGTDDGCGGRCVGPCPNPFAACEAPEYSCVCTPRCSETARCGDDDGCGGRCTTGCGVGEMCDPVMRRCICVSRCPAPERFNEFGCGMPVPNECPGGPLCGLGTGCPTGFRCSAETNTCECMTGCPPPPDGGMMMGEKDGGMMMMCGSGLTACGTRCVNTMANDDHCGACGAPCPAETHCMAGRCQCTGTLSLCSDHCVNTQTDNNNCGGCGTTCPARTNCMAGRCECIPSCTIDANSISCGTDITNACPGAPSCGVGRLCPSGTVCDTRARACVCVPRCPAGVRCGTSDGCGGQCVGGCDTTGETCTQDSTDLHRYFCSAASCAGGCRCDEVCASNRCTRVTCPFGDVPCPCACCPYGSQCVAGACVAVPP